MARSAGSACSPRMPFTRSQGAAPAPSSAGGARAGRQLPQLLPARVEERRRARLVAIQRRAGPVPAVHHVELELSPLADLVGEEGGSL